jgi:hypothetical protein
MSIGREEYEERYGEHVIHCNVHGGTHIDSCPVCEEEDMAEKPTIICVTCRYESKDEEDFIEGTPLCHSCHDNYMIEVDTVKYKQSAQAERLAQAINTDYLH